MKKKLSTYEIAEMLRADQNANWSYEGAHALAGYLEEIEASSGEEIEFDPVAIRCDFAEYSSAREAAKEHSFDAPEGADEEESERAALEYLQGNRQVIEFDGGIIVSAF